jgi:hypothetical protein
MTLFLVLHHEKSWVSQWTFKAKAITIDDITLPVIASNHLQNTSTFRMQKAKYSSAKELISTQYANKRATWMLGTIKESRSPVICQRQMQASQCRSSKKLLQHSLMSHLFMAL